MILKTFVLTCLLFTSSLAFSAPTTSTEEVFRVAPYMLKHTKGNLLLNFQTANDQNLIVEDDGQIKRGFTYQKNQQYKIELSPAACDSIKEVKILDAKSKDVLYQNTLPPAPCNSMVGNEAFTFGFISDTQEHKNRHEDIAKIIAHHQLLDPLQFIINGGDVVQTGDAEKDWIDYFLGGKLYLMDIPQIAAIGNHDYRGGNGALIPKYFKQFMRWDGADKYGNLFFDFPEVQILILNSNFSEFSLMEELRVWKWIEDKMKESKRVNKPLIIATHFPVYSSSLNRFSSMNVIKMRVDLVPLIEKYKIPLVLSGHTHMYERSFKDGIHYVVAGPAGGRPNKPSYENEYVKFLDFQSLTFTKIKLAKKVFNIETYNQENKLIDSVSIDLNTKSVPPNPIGSRYLF